MLFGPQALSFQEDLFHQLKSIVLENAENRWILDTLAELPSLLKTFLEKFPKLQATSGVQLLEDLNDWFKTAKVPPASFELPNVLLSPLVVLTQLTQYSNQHIIIAINAVHATHSLTESTKNIRKALRPDGFLVMLEMTETLYWIGMIFGALEGWWLFDDGRQHAISHQSRWGRELQSVGYGHVEWTDGNCPENNIQRIIIAMGSAPKYDHLPISPKPADSQAADSTARQIAVDGHVLRSTQGFTAPVRLDQFTAPSASDQCVPVTGATGSLGSHLVAHFAELPNMNTVICLNRHISGSEPEARQRQSMESRGIKIDTNAHSNLRVFETDTAKPMLGLPQDKYEVLQKTVTHVVHNAWPMSGKRPLKGFELQFQVMRNLIDFIRDIACRRDDGSKVSLQFISSIATVGSYHFWSGNVNVPEERMTIESVLPNGYGDAKFVCERMLDETLTQVSRPVPCHGSASWAGCWF